MAKEKKGKIITITSMKGGVGKTTTLLLLASVYKNMNKKILLIDLDLFTGSISFLLNADVKNSIFNICDDMNNNRYKGINSGEYVCHFDENIDIISAPKDPRQANKVDRRCLEILLNSISNNYDVILIDTNHTIDVYSMIAFNASDVILNIFTNDAMDLKGTKSFVSICKNLNVNNLLLVLNEAQDERKSYFSEFDIKSIVKSNIDYIIPRQLYIMDFDMYVIENTLFKQLLKLKKSSKKNYEIIEKLAIKLLEDKKEANSDEEE